jgi:hypothetical protein
VKKWRENNLETHQHRLAEWRRKNPGKVTLQRKKWRALNLDRERATNSYAKRRYTAFLKASYVKQLLRYNTRLDSLDIPQGLISLKTEHLKLKRLCQLTTSTI